MGNVSVTTLVNGTLADASQVMADFQAIVDEINGNLEATTNIRVGSAGTLSGNVNSAGTSNALSAADHQHKVQGFENLPTTPSSLFNGRVWWDTSTSQHKYVADASGPTVGVLSNLSATDLVHHAAQHVDGAADQLADTSIAERSMKSRTIAKATLASSVGPLTANTWTTVVDLSVTTTGIQTLLVTVRLAPGNGSATLFPVVGMRVVDVTNSSTTIYRSPVGRQMGTAGGGNDQFPLCDSFSYTVPATGARTLRVQANASTAQVTINKTTTMFTDTAIPATIEAVIL